MIIIKETKRALSAYNNMGRDHMVPISEASAMKLYNGQLYHKRDLPAMGCESTALSVPARDFPSFHERLLLQNISGSFYLASSSTPVSDWPAVFGVHVQRQSISQA